MLEITDKQKALAKEIHELRIKAGWVWVPKVGDWLLYHNRIYLCHRLYKADSGWRICFRRPGDLPHEHDYAYPNEERKFIPIPSWSDCRALLREMGWVIDHFIETDPIETVVMGEPIKRGITLYIRHRKDQTDCLSAEAPDDLTAIMLVVLEALKQKADADKSG